jgi:hypothetical protein
MLGTLPKPLIAKISRLKANESIEIMNFYTNLFSGQSAHNNQLTVLSCVQHVSKVIVLQSRFLDIY